MELLDRVCQNTKKYIEKMPKEQRKKIWAVFYKQGSSCVYG